MPITIPPELHEESIKTLNRAILPFSQDKVTRESVLKRVGDFDAIQGYDHELIAKLLDNAVFPIVHERMQAEMLLDKIAAANPFWNRRVRPKLNVNVKK